MSFFVGQCSVPRYPITQSKKDSVFSYSFIEILRKVLMPVNMQIKFFAIATIVEEIELSEELITSVLNTLASSLIFCS